MKVLHIVKTSERVEWAFKQAKWLKENGIDIITVLPNENKSTFKKYADNNMKVIIEDFMLPIKQPWKIFSRVKKIRKIVTEVKPDIIHTHFLENIVMLRIALRKSKIPRLFQIPGPLHLENKLLKYIDIKTSNDYDYWGPACIKSLELCKKAKINTKKVFLAYYGGYGGNEVFKYSESKNILHNEYNIPRENIIIGMISYFYKPRKILGQKKGIKGHEDFIEAIEILSKKYDNITALIIGGPWEDAQKYEKGLKEFAKKKNLRNIIFTGFRNDIKDIYKEIDIAVHPSHTENLGGAAESLAAGIPTIATNVGGFPDIVKDNQTGYLCEAKNPQDIADKIEKVINNKGKALEMAKLGQKNVKEMLDINNTAKNIKEIYIKIIKDVERNEF